MSATVTVARHEGQQESRGTVVVELLTYLADEMDTVARVYPLAGLSGSEPAPVTAAQLEDLRRRVDRRAGPIVGGCFDDWLAVRARLLDTAAALDRIKHEEHDQVSDMLHRLREDREELLRCARDLREALAREVDGHRPALDDVAIVPARTVEAIDWRAMGVPGISYKELASGVRWHSGLLRLAPGSQLARHAHSAVEHHLWVLEGTCSVLGETLDAGSYAFVPHSTSHALEARGTVDRTLAYVSTKKDGD